MKVLAAQETEKSNGRLILLITFAFSILYRSLLLYRHVYPPGPDLGLHNSIINSLSFYGDFAYNHYHMGGGVSLTHPGFHIFTYSLMIFTGIPDFLAQSIVGLLFSSLMVLIAFLLTDKVLGVSPASLIAAFLAAISMSDIEMLIWGGYPNVVALTLIPLVYYVWLREDYPLKTSVLTTSILIGAIVITHSLSTFVFGSIVAPFIVYELFKSRKEYGERRTFFSHLLSIFIGLLISLPFMVKMVPLYVKNVYSYMSARELNEIERGIILTRKIPLELILLTFIPFFSFFLFSKRYRGKFLDKTSLLFGLWVLVPVLLTQSFIFGLYIDYYRLLYFILLPVAVFFALLIHHSSSFLAGIATKLTQKSSFNEKTIYSLFLIVFLMFSCNLRPFSAFPSVLFEVADYYQVVYAPGFNAIEFIKQKTYESSIFVADDGLGWWVSGFGRRITLSSVEPRFLILPREVESALIARKILETDFILSNGFIEVREDGGYVGRHNPMLLLCSERFVDPYPVFYFNNSETTIFYEVQQDNLLIDALRIPVETVKVQEGAESASISIVKANSHIKLVQRTEISKNSHFITYSLTVESITENVSLRYVRLTLRSWGKVVNLENGVGVLYLNDRICGQVIFEEEEPLTSILDQRCLELIYAAKHHEKIEIKIVMGAFEVEKTEEEYALEYLGNMSVTWKSIKNGGTLEVFDYRKVLAEKNISFIFCNRDFPIMKFVNDPLFNLVFINDEIAIFEVRSDSHRNFFDIDYLIPLYLLMDKS